MGGAAPIDQPIGSGVSPGQSDRLESWKEIAAYLKRGVTTVQRWEREEGLPVHRHLHDTLGSVYAFQHELEAWRAKRDALDNAVKPLTPRAIVARLAAWRTFAWKRILKRGAALLIAVGVGAALGRLDTSTTPGSVRRLTVVLPSAAARWGSVDRNLAITPDGTYLVYVGGTSGSRLFVRALHQFDSRPITDAISPRYPFISPDSQWIGYVEGFRLKKVRINGGLTSELTLVNSGIFRGASWGPDNAIAFSVDGRLMRISAEGGSPELLLAPNEQAAYRWPEYLPDGRALLFTILPTGDWSDGGTQRALEGARIAVLDLETREQKIVLDGGSHARYLESGHLLYAAVGTLNVVPFDLNGLTVTGPAITVVPQLAMTREGAGMFDVARDGTLVYAIGGVDSDLAVMTWVDRHGNEEAIGAPPFSYRNPRVSPEGTRIAFGSPRDLGVWDVATQTFSWFGVGPSSHPVWLADGQRLIFASTRAGPANIYLQDADRRQPVVRLTHSPRHQYPLDITPDGRYLVFREDGASSDLMLFDLMENRVEPLIQAASMDFDAEFSPDGNLLAYSTNVGGREDVYVQPFPDRGTEPWKVSSGGGMIVKWAPSSRELFYTSLDRKFMSVPVQQLGGTLIVGTPTAMFDAGHYLPASAGRIYDVAPAAQRFLMTKPVSGSEQVTSASNLQVVLNWHLEFPQLFPR